jgi:hypothetical protein
LNPDIRIGLANTIQFLIESLKDFFFIFLLEKNHRRKTIMPKKREISREKEKLIEMLVRKEELVADVTNELEFSLPLIVLPNQ